MLIGVTAGQRGRQVLADKMRVHILAKELNIPSKVIVEKCKAEGIDSVKNHMSTLSAGLHATIREWLSDGTHSTTVETATRVDVKKVQLKRRTKRTASTTNKKVKMKQANQLQRRTTNA